MRDEDVTAAVFVGHFSVDAGLLADAAERENAFAVGSSDDVAGQAVWYASAPETLVGEELFAAAAYVGGSPAQMASLTVQDIVRWVVIAALVVGSVLKLAGVF
jgi:hypothetical protein